MEFTFHHRLLNRLLFSFEGVIPQINKVKRNEQVKEVTERAPERTLYVRSRAKKLTKRCEVYL